MANRNYRDHAEDEHGNILQYSDSVYTYANDTGKGKYKGVLDWAENDKERCENYVGRLKTEFLKRTLTYWDGSGYEEVQCARKAGHKGACLNDQPYPGDLPRKKRSA